MIYALFLGFLVLASNQMFIASESKPWINLVGNLDELKRERKSLVNAVSNLDELKEVGIFDELNIKKVGTVDSTNSKWIQHGDVFGLKKTATNCTSAYVGTMVAAMIYPPAIPFIVWSLKTKLAVGAVAGCVGLWIMRQSVLDRCEALEVHNKSDDGSYYKITVLHPWELCVKPLQKYLAFTVGFGAAISFMGLAYNRCNIPV